MSTAANWGAFFAGFISATGLVLWLRLERGRDQDRAERRRHDRHPPSDPGADEFSAQDTYDPRKETT